jgi:hypothetical protein
MTRRRPFRQGPNPPQHRQAERRAQGRVSPGAEALENPATGQVVVCQSGGRLERSAADQCVRTMRWPESPRHTLRTRASASNSGRVARRAAGQCSSSLSPMASASPSCRRCRGRRSKTRWCASAPSRSHHSKRPKRPRGSSCRSPRPPVSRELAEGFSFALLAGVG